MKHDPSVYAAVVSQFFTDEVIKHIEEIMNPQDVGDSSINLTPEIELTNRMIKFAIQYTGLEVKQHYTPEEIEKIASIHNILQDKADKAVIENAIKRLENSSPEFKEQFPQYKSVIERYKRMLQDLDN